VRARWLIGCVAAVALLLVFIPSAAAQTTIAWQPSHQDDTGYAGWHEYLICKDIYDRTVAQLPPFTNILAWETTMGLWGTNNGGGTNRKAFDSEIAQANAADADVFISVHINGNSPSGFTGFYFSGDAASARHASSLMRSVAATMNMPYLGTVGMDFYSLNPVRNKAPVRLLLELGDNVRDRVLLSSVEGRQKIADALAKAVAGEWVQRVTPCCALRGLDRYDTAIKLSQAAFPTVLPAGSGLVLAPGETFPEALCGAPLAAAYGGPVLLCPKAGLNNAVRTELQRLAPQTVVVIGLSNTVVGQVRAALPTSDVQAINGTGPTASIVYDMSRKVANALAAKVGTGGKMTGATAIITPGDKYPDALGVSPLACAMKWPIILTPSTSNTLHTSAAGALTDLGITQAIKVGTYVTLPAGVAYRAGLNGTDRYDTNAKVANWAKTNAGLTFTHFGVTTGQNFPDALASGSYLAKDGGILLLSPLGGPLPPTAAALITADRAAVQHVTFIACIEPVIGQVKTVLP
jgi:putative cell wall-binding protein